MKSTFTVLSIMLFAFGCKTKETQVTKYEEKCVAVSSELNAQETVPGKFNILSVQQDGDFLKLDVEYAGADNSGIFMIWNGMLMKSMPPKVSVQVGYYTSKTTTMIKRTICYDISKLRENTRKQGLIIMIEGFDKSISIPAEK
jgi:hypothetical protein